MKKFKGINKETVDELISYLEEEQSDEEMQDDFFDGYDVGYRVAVDKVKTFFGIPTKEEKMSNPNKRVVTITPPQEVTKQGTNKCIKVNNYSDKALEQTGFRKVKDNHWYLCRKLDKDITFNMDITITDDQPELTIDVLDEQFLQPYDYQALLTKDPSFEYAQKIFDKVEEVMSELTDAKIITGHKYGEYI